MKNWKGIKEKKQQAAAGRLDRYIKRIVEKHPDRYVEILKKEIRSKNFEKNVEEEYNISQSDLEDVYRVFNDPGYQEEIEELIKNLKVEDDF